MPSGRLKDYLGKGLLAELPVSLDLTPGALGVYYATDDPEGLYMWDGTAWQRFAGRENAVRFGGFIPGKMLLNTTMLAVYVPKEMELQSVSAKALVSGASQVFSVRRNGVEVSNFTVTGDTGAGVVEEVFSAGDILSIYTAIPDANLADVTFLFEGA